MNNTTNNSNSNNLNSNNINNSNNVINPTISIQERAIIIENIKKFLIEHLPADQVTSPQKAHELAVRFETHVALTTTTKEQYQGMIAEKLRIIKQKSTEPSPILLSTTGGNSVTASPTPQTTQTTLNPQEIAQITGRLNQIRPQIPQIDKLLLLHSKLTAPPTGTLEMAKKLSDCRNILVNQLELCTVTTTSTKKATFVMNLSQLNLLIEQVQRLFNSLVSKMKESAGIQGSINTNNSIPNQNNQTKLNSSPSLSVLSTSSASSKSSLSSSKSTTKSAINNNLMSSDSIDKILLQRLSLPPDQQQQQLYPDDNWLKKFILHTYSNPHTFVNNKHLKMRNRLLFHELKLLKASKSNLKFHVQEIGLGNLSILISNQNYRFIFKISAKYPYDQLIYRVETVTITSKNSSSSGREPKTFPLTITNILRNNNIL